MQTKRIYYVFWRRHCDDFQHSFEYSRMRARTTYENEALKKEKKGRKENLFKFLFKEEVEVKKIWSWGSIINSLFCNWT